MTTITAPTLWVGAPSNLTGTSNSAGQQFMDLFSNPAAWQSVAGQATGFVLTETFILTATDAQLATVFNFLNANHLRMMMVTAMIPVQPNGVGNGVEGFTTPAALNQALQRIKSLGGNLTAIGMDAPLSEGHTYATGPQLSIAALAQQVAISVKQVQAVFPATQFYDGQGFVSTADLGQWAQAFQQATGTPIAEFDADVNWNLSDWQTQLQAYAQAATAAGVAFGINGNATGQQQSNLAWTLGAEGNIAAAMADPLTRPATILVQSWNPNPTIILPEGMAGTLSHVAAEIAQFSPLYASGYLTGGAGVTVTTAAPTASYAGSATDAVAGSAVAVPCIGITASAPAGMTFAVIVTAITGTLGATASGAGHVILAAPGVITLTGNLTDINAELASLSYTGPAAGTDTIDITTYDGTGLVDDHQIAVSIAAPVAVTLPSGIGTAALYQAIYGTAPSTAVTSAAQAKLNAGQTLAQAAAPWIAQAQATITALCEKVQGATPSSSVIASLIQALIGGQSLAQIRATLAGAATVQSELASVYQSHTGQAPATEQLSALTQQLASGASLRAVEAPLLANGPAEAQVTAIFQQVAGQAPDATTLVTNARALLTGTTAQTLRNTLATSPQVQANLAALYQHVYGQSPTAAQLAALTAQLESGTTYAQIQAQFTTIAQTAVTAAFQSVLGRAPTNAELSANTQGLLSGNLSNGSMISTLAYSAASAANVTAMYQQVAGQTPPDTMVQALEKCLCIGNIPLSQLRTDLVQAVTIYQQITGQPATADALTPLMYDFLCHATISQIRAWIGFSGQENTLIGTAYQQLFGNGISGTILNSLETALVAGTTTMAEVKASLTAQAAADVPVIAAVAPNQAATANSLVLPFGAIAITDPNAGAIEKITVSLSGAGRLAGGGGGTLNAAGTVYTSQGTAAIVSAGLRGLIFWPAAAGGTTQLVLTVQNGAQHTTSNTVAITSQTLRSPASTAFLYAPSQSATMAVSASNETFVLPAGGFGADTITGFNVAQNIIALPKAIAANFAAVQAHETSSDGGTMIAFGQSGSIFLPGVAPSALHASNFSFV